MPPPPSPAQTGAAASKTTAAPAPSKPNSTTPPAKPGVPSATPSPPKPGTTTTTPPPSTTTTAKPGNAPTSTTTAKPGAAAAASTTNKTGSPATSSAPAPASPVKKAPPPPPKLDATFADGSFIFIPDDKEAYIPGKVLKTFKQGESGGEVSIITVEGRETTRSCTITPDMSKQCMAMDIQSLDPVSDMVDLRQLNEASILHNLRLRFKSDDVYTTIGNILVAVNPFKTLEIYTPDVMNDYIRHRISDPHVFSVADRAYKSMTESHHPQACIVAGESGAGKTETTKLFLKYLAEVSANRDDDGTNSSRSQSIGSANSSTANLLDETGEAVTLQEKILEANPLMEAFGNAKTVRNDNSSRFGKWIAVGFDTAHGKVVGGNITSYLLERTRVVSIADGERGYHVFYQLCAAAGMDKVLRGKFALQPATDYSYLNQSSCVVVDSINDARHWQHTVRAMEVVGVIDQKFDIVSVLAGILHLGNVEMLDQEKAVLSANKDPLTLAAMCFGVSDDALETAIIKRDVSVRGEKILKDLTKDQAIQARDALSKAVYSLLFDWLLMAINKSLGNFVADVPGNGAPEPAAAPKGKVLGTPSAVAKPKPQLAKNVIIGVLDIFGFESFTTNSFEQLCINYCNEKLQGHFNEHIFLLEQNMYEAEGLDVSKIEFRDNADLLAMLESKPKGFFFMMDEECAIPHGSDEGFLRTIYKELAGQPDQIVKKPDVSLVRNDPRWAMIFIVNHYAGPVEYTVTSFLEKNKDELPPEIEALLNASENEFITTICDAAKHGNSNSAKERRKSQSSSSGAKAKKQSLSSKFKDQLTELMATLRTTEPHFVRCVKPNAAKVADVFTSTMVLSQLRYSGLLEVCRIRQNGYPTRKTFSEFAFRYGPLCEPRPRKGDHQDVCSKLERQQIVPERKTGAWQVGKTQIFLRTETFNRLESARDEKLKSFAVTMQKVARGYVQRMRFAKYQDILKGLKAAIQANEESKLESAILRAGALPYTGIHLPQVQAAREAIARLRAQQRARDMIRQACESRELSSIQVALESASSVGLDPLVDETCKVATALIATIKRELATKEDLRQAIKARNLEMLNSALNRAYELSLESTTEAEEARVMKRRVEKVNEVAEMLRRAIAEQQSERDIMMHVNTLVELGFRDHPMVREGEKAAKVQAEVSAAHAARVADCKRAVFEAAENEDLAALEQAESRAIELGISNDKEMIPLLAKRAVFEHWRDLSNGLKTQMQALQVRSGRSEGISEEDIQLLSQAIANARKDGLRDDHEIIARAMEFEALAHKQLLAKRNLQDALKAQKENKDDDGAQIKLAMDQVMELGMQDETARRGQAALAIKTATLENLSSRRASMMPGSSMTGMHPRTTGGMDAKLSKQPSTQSAFKVLIKATNEDRQKVCAERIKAANSPSFRAKLSECADNDNFYFERYLGLRTDEDFTEHSDVSKKKKHAKRKCKHVGKVIPKSLLKLEGELAEEAINIHKSILGWAGDLSGQFPAALAQSVLKYGQTNPALKDEIFCQLLKQCNENPDAISEERTWILFCLCCEHFAPTKEFVNYVVQSLLKLTGDLGIIGNYSRWCLFQLGASLELGSSPYSMPMKEIEKYVERPPVLLRVHQTYRVLHEQMAWSDMPVWPDHDVGFVERMVAKQIGLDDNVLVVSGLFLKDIPYYGNASNRTNSPKVSEDMRNGASYAAGPKPELLSPTGAKSTRSLTRHVSSEPSGGNGGGGRSGSEDHGTFDDNASVSSTSKNGLNRKSIVKAATSFFGRRSVNRTGGGGGGLEGGKRDLNKATLSFKGKLPGSFMSAVPGKTTAAANAAAKNRAAAAMGDTNFVAVGGKLDTSESSAAGGSGGDADKAVIKVEKGNVNRVPPPPFAPWPLPRDFHLGDVFLRLVKQDRLPFLTYQRKLFLANADVAPDKPTFIQIMQDVVNNRLPIAGEADIVQLAVVALVRNIRLRKVPIPPVALISEAGLFNYIPNSWTRNFPAGYWVEKCGAFMTEWLDFFQNASEEDLMLQYIDVCKNQPLFGASLFSVIRRDAPGDYVAAVNYNGLWLLTNDAYPVTVGNIKFTDMVKVGASATFVWCSVKEEAKLAWPDLFPGDQTILYLHSQQAKECYQLILDYTYYFTHEQTLKF